MSLFSDATGHGLGTPSRDEIMAAAVKIAQGELVAFPTETVYGLGADASNPQAVAKIYEAKGRPNNHPVIVHVAGPEHARQWVKHLPEQAKILMNAFWPGPLTLILKRASWVDPCVSGGQDTIGIRCPSHPVAQGLLQAFAQLRGVQPVGIAAPSANRFGHVSPTTAAHVRDEFPEQVLRGMPVLEGGCSQVGIESTILDLSRLDQGVAPSLLRPGSVLSKELEEVLGVRLADYGQDAPRVSGSLKAHYSPRTPMRLVPASDMVSSVRGWCQQNPDKRLAVIGASEPPGAITGVDRARVQWHGMPEGPTQYAQMLYAQLRAMDSLAVDQLFWEEVPHTPAWAGIRDRLQRAAAAFEPKSCG